MVGVAVCKQLTSPDLGCSAYTNEADCMVMMQPFDGSAHACAWDPTIDPPCDTAPPDTSSNFTPLSIAMLVIVMLCIDPFILVIEVGAATGGEKAARTRLLPNATPGGRRAAWDYCALAAAIEESSVAAAMPRRVETGGGCFLVTRVIPLPLARSRPKLAERPNARPSPCPPMLRSHLRASERTGRHVVSLAPLRPARSTTTPPPRSTRDARRRPVSV